MLNVIILSFFSRSINSVKVETVKKSKEYDRFFLKM